MPESSYNKGGIIRNVVMKRTAGGEYVRLRHRSKQDIYSVSIINVYALSNGISANFKIVLSGYSENENYVYQFGRNSIGFSVYKKNIDGYTELVLKLGENGNAIIEVICEREIVITVLGSSFDISAYTKITPTVL